MKKKIISYAVLVTLAVFSSQALKAQYIELTTGRNIQIVKHQGNGMIYNVETQRPVYLYIDPTSKDTFYGRTGEKVNGRLMYKEGKYWYAGDQGYVYRDGTFKVRSEEDKPGYYKEFQGDGDKKVTWDGYKRKEGSDGDIKVKDGSMKLKLEEDGVVKLKDSVNNYKMKIDDEGNYLEKDDSLKIKAKADGKIKVKDKNKDAKAKIDEDDGDAKIKTKKEKRKMKRDKRKTKKKDDE